MGSNKKADTIGGRIKSLRESAKLTQEELAKQLYISREKVNMWENGSRMIKGEDVAKIADALHTTCDYLLRGISSDHVEVNKVTGLNDSSLNTLKFADDYHRQIWAETLNAIISRPQMLDELHKYLFLNVDSFGVWDKDIRATGGYKAIEGEYERLAPLVDSKSGQCYPVDASILCDAILLTVEGELRKLKEGLKDGQHQKGG